MQRNSGFLLVELIFSLAILALCSSCFAICLARFFDHQSERNSLIQALSYAVSCAHYMRNGIPRPVSYQDKYYRIEKQSVPDMQFSSILWDQIVITQLSNGAKIIQLPAKCHA